MYSSHHISFLPTPPALSSSTLSNYTPHNSQLEITIRLLTTPYRKRSNFLRESDLQSPRALGAELVDGREVEGQCVEGGVLFYQFLEDFARLYRYGESQQSNVQQGERGRVTDFGHATKVEEANAEVLAIHW